jgi:CHAT domain-containing protein
MKSLRVFFKTHGVAVLPASGEGLPDAGRPIFASGESVDIVHLSTHSVPDREVPLLDSLAFPKDQVYVYDLALSPIRAKLVVLSACELFRPLVQRAYHDPAVSAQEVARTVSLFPVSGISTASLGRIAPQVVSTLWTVSAESPATELFMLRFYSELLKSKNPRKRWR